jgi:DNA processing protein
MTQDDDAELLALLALHLAEGVGPQRAAALVEHFGSPAAAVQAGEAALACVPGIGPKTAAAIRRSHATGAAQAELRRAREAGVSLHALGRPGYPAWLAPLAGAPPVLFVRGEVVPADERAVAIVGTRHPTSYGRRVAARLAEGLARAGVVVVSGLARGIDGIAHQASLDAGGRTIACLAGGLSRIYPPEHRGLAERIASQGALVTESVMGQEPLRGLFPARNRIISGLSRAVVIVQAGEKSGALITAEHAAEQGKTVLAVPGPVDEEQSAGCHQLIRDGAALCRGVEDILEELEGGLHAPASRPGHGEAAPLVPEKPAPPEDGPEAVLWSLLDGGPRHVDELVRETGLEVQQLTMALTMMELARRVRRLPGGHYERA